MWYVSSATPWLTFRTTTTTNVTIAASLEKLTSATKMRINLALTFIAKEERVLRQSETDLCTRMTDQSQLLASFLLKRSMCSQADGIVDVLPATSPEYAHKPTALIGERLGVVWVLKGWL